MPAEFTVQEAAYMADSVYQAEIPRGIATSGPPPIRGYAPQRWVHEEASGFTGAIYTSQRSPLVVLAFAGTNFRSWGDVKADLQIAQTQVPIGQLDPANRLYIAAKDAAAGREVVAVGHSLGGGLAQFIASAYGLRAATFNAPAMGGHMQMWSTITATRPVDERSLRARIVNFRALLDPVSVGLQLMSAFQASTKPLLIAPPAMDTPWARHLGRVVTLGLGAGLHGMGGMIRYIDKQPWAGRSPWEVEV